ncbi:predicted protein [Chaetomium globosum CBS 148.51]|uniref:Uncharacterized protein n=1 Tax=Chaetomium globosum (strain ATCC 6205 / CBS 148.51 / DSM 1962 / NBRC 6347 / NRRL 1970) TaxID=306901 RepID=Q2GPE6_CHAGB|nr:uncharacterized protein CHGG_10158 [Chaetomium globosum CBS 148.51]EAQ83754.1 predicted protein [Chaetomium globosum CBS 148.51]
MFDAEVVIRTTPHIPPPTGHKHTHRISSTIYSHPAAPHVRVRVRVRVRVCVCVCVCPCHGPPEARAA